MSDHYDNNMQTPESRDEFANQNNHFETKNETMKPEYHHEYPSVEQQNFQEFNNLNSNSQSENKNNYQDTYSNSYTTNSTNYSSQNNQQIHRVQAQSYPNYYETGSMQHSAHQNRNTRNNAVYYQNEKTHTPTEEEKIAAIVKREVDRVKPKNVWAKALACFLVGTILGSGGLFGMWKMGILGNQSETSQANVTQQTHEEIPQNMKISLNESSTVENAVAKKAIPSIVGITALVKGQENPFYFYNEVPQYAEAVGSGIIVDSSGYILTNSHVINNGDAEKLTVSFSNDETTEAKIIWNDQTLDLAIIKVEKDNLPVAELGDSSAVQVGDKAIAVGNPLGLDLQSTLTSGYISGLNRTINVQGGNIMDGLIQTDAAINSGNSGGALLNANGEVIGINTARPQTADGIGFAIPINDLKPIIQKVIDEGTYQSLYIGITGNNAQLYARMSEQKLPTDKGVVVNQVMDNSPAEKAGLKPGDIITAINDQEVDSMNSLKTQLLHYNLGDTVTLTFLRDGKENTVEIEFVDFSLPQQQG